MVSVSPTRAKYRLCMCRLLPYVPLPVLFACSLPWRTLTSANVWPPSTLLVPLKMVMYILLVAADLQNNSICSLKGSLSHFKFLETLDLSNNQLRNLPKLAANLAKFQYLTFLNLKVQPTMTAYAVNWCFVLMCQILPHSLKDMYAISLLSSDDVYMSQTRDRMGSFPGASAAFQLTFYQRCRWCQHRQ